MFWLQIFSNPQPVTINIDGAIKFSTRIALSNIMAWDTSTVEYMQICCHITPGSDYNEHYREDIQMFKLLYQHPVT